jgi:WD40 repeat protein
VYGVAFSPDGRTIASGGWDGTVRLYGLVDGGERILRGHGGKVHAVAFLDDKRLASASWDTTARLWDLGSGSEIARIVDGNPLVSLAVSPDRETIAVGGGLDSSVRLYTLDGKRSGTLAGHVAPAAGLAFTPDGRHLVSAGLDKTVRLWDERARAEVAHLQAHGDWVGGVSTDGRLIASGSLDRTLRLYDLERLRHAVTPSRAHEAAVYGAAFRSDGRELATCANDGTVRVWDVETGTVTRVYEGHTSGVVDVAFQPHTGLLASTGLDGTRL